MPEHIYRVEFSVSRPLDPKDKHEAIVTEINGTVVASPLNSGKEVEVGHLSGLRVRTIFPFESILLACDAHSGGALEFIETLLEPETANFKENVAKEMGDPIAADLLCLEHLQIEPAHRGRLLGLLTVWQFMNEFSDGCGLVVCNPFPPQFAGWEEPDCDYEARVKAAKREGLVDDREKALKKLRDYYGRLGFKPLRGTPLMALNNEMKRPAPPFGLRSRSRRSRPTSPSIPEARSGSGRKGHDVN